ncbi:hypothetical protein BDR26DRAFT_876492 [Obelidium mucronatum]|nr:hypothetical protein BDR26DRAFT_876492 [Obelidium mucronatum]
MVLFYLLFFCSFQLCHRRRKNNFRRSFRCSGGHHLHPFWVWFFSWQVKAFFSTQACCCKKCSGGRYKTPENKSAVIFKQ